jgi:hypothetical protein
MACRGPVSSDMDGTDELMRSLRVRDQDSRTVEFCELHVFGACGTQLEMEVKDLPAWKR